VCGLEITFLFLGLIVPTKTSPPKKQESFDDQVNK
jgi:hypothetical protein